MNLTNEITKRLKVFGLKNNEINHFFTTNQIPCINIHAEKKELPSVILVATNILAKENNITPYLIVVSETSIGTVYTILTISQNETLKEYNIQSLLENNVVVLNSNAIRLIWFLDPI